jgi:predicted nucleic acid-binding protein
MTQYLIDTDWVIHYLHGHTAIVERLDELQPQGLILSIVSLAELYAATALQYDLTLLTNNRLHFERIDGLRIESV